MGRSKTSVLGWRGRGGWGAALIVAYVAIVCLPIALALAAEPGSDDPAGEQLGLAAALLGFSLLAMQAVLAGRFHTVDSPFGLDVVMRFHKSMAVLALVLLLAHPVLIAAGEGEWGLLGLETAWPVDLGKAALALLVVGGVLALLATRLPVDYQKWRISHRAMPVVVILGFVHSMSIGEDLQRPLLRTYWTALFAAAVAVVLWRNAVVPLCRRRFRVASVEPASHDTFSVRLEPDDDRPAPPRDPGQFMFLRLVRPGRRSEEHPFTISAAPSDDALVATIKKSGDFTNTIDRTRPGDTARVEAPFGRFSYVHHDAEQFVFIAGGVGITPVISMLRALRESGDTRPVVLIYGNQAERDILFRDELRSLGEHVRVVHVLSKPDEGWDGPTGYVTGEIVEAHAGDRLATADVYLCGPPPMMDMVYRALRELGVSDRRIHWERFSL